MISHLSPISTITDIATTADRPNKSRRLHRSIGSFPLHKICDTVFFIISSYFSIGDCASLSCSSRFFKERVNHISWKSVAMQMGRSLASMPQEQFESFVTMVGKLPQIQFNEVFSSRIGKLCLFHALLHPDYMPQLKVIFTHFSLEKISFLLNQETEAGLNFLHIVCNYNNPKFMAFILKQIPDVYRGSSLTAKTSLQLSPLFYSVYNDSVLAIIPLFQMSGQLELALKRTYRNKMQSLNFMQQLFMHGSIRVIKSILGALSDKEKQLFLTMDKLQDQPLAYLYRRGKIGIQPNQAILVLKEVENHFSKERCQKLIEDAELLLYSLSAGAFELATYIISRYPSLMMKRTSHGNRNVWHQLGLAWLHTLKERERIEFLKKHDSLLKSGQLDEIDHNGYTPALCAYRSGLNQLAECFIKAGASPSIQQSLYSTKLLAQHWSVNGDIDFKGHSYQLKLWENTFALKEIFQSLEAFSLTYADRGDLATLFPMADLQDLVSLFSIFSLPITEQLTAMKLRAAQNKIWIKPLGIKIPGGGHAVTIIGSSKLVLFFNRIYYSDPVTGMKISPSIIPFIPPPDFCFDEILSWKDGSNFSLSTFTHLKFTMLTPYLLEQQRMSNCAFVSNAGGVFAYMGLSKIQGSDATITDLLIQTAFDLVKPVDTVWRSFNRWWQFNRHRDHAEKQLVAAIESLALIRFARKTLQNSSNPILSLTQDDPSCFLLRSYRWGDLSVDQKAFFNHLSKTNERYRFIQTLMSFNTDWNMRLAEYIQKRHLTLYTKFN